LVAEVALPGRVLLSVKDDGVVRTGIDAGPAPRTFLLLENDDSIVPPGDGLHRTCLDAGSILAVPAHTNAECNIKTALSSMGPFLGNPDEPDPIARGMLLLACRFTGQTPPAGILIDIKLIAVHGRPPLSFSGYILQRSVRMWVAPMAGSQFS
jgi:hypothetical protein